VHDDIIVLAAGPSVKEYNLRDLDQRGHVIAVNGASIYSRCHVAFTMDRLIAEHCYPIWKVQGAPEMWIRKGVMKNTKPGPEVMQFSHDGNRDGTVMSMEHGFLNGSNSGTCAFNLALQRAVKGNTKRIFLLGYDMQRFDKDCNPYWYPAFDWNKAGGTKDGNLKVWAEEYLKIAPQAERMGVKVYNVNHASRLTAFQTISFADFKGKT
jgi:hypothetical protein